MTFNGIIIFIYGAKTSHLISIKDFLVSIVLPMFTSVLGFFLGDDEETNRKNDSRFEEINQKLISIEKKISRNDSNNQEENKSNKTENPRIK